LGAGTSYDGVSYQVNPRASHNLARIRPLEQFPCGCTGESMHSWPFSLKENGTAMNLPLHSNREIALRTSEPPHFCSEQPSSSRAQPGKKNRRCPIGRALCESPLLCLSCCHPRRGSAVALCSCLFSSPKAKVSQNQRIVISTEAVHAFVSGEIRFSTRSSPKATHSIVLTIATKYFSSFSAQKSHVKPRNHLTRFLSSTSTWHVS
jgi:hypothetical protein